MNGEKYLVPDVGLSLELNY